MLSFVDKLDPPADTEFFQKYVVALCYQVTEYLSCCRETFTLVDQSYKEAGGAWARHRWRVDVYVYPTGGLPTDTEGWARNGQINIVVVHTGDLTSNGAAFYNWPLFETILQGPQVQLPINGSGSKTSDEEIRRCT